jgi:hypothetical protein
LTPFNLLRERADLRSWVADWSIRWACYPLSPPNFDGSPSYFTASESKSSIENISDPIKLCIRGILVNAIKGDPQYRQRLPACLNSRIHFKYGLRITCSRGVSSYHQAEDPRFKTMTAELSHYLDVRTGPTRQCCIQNSRIGFLTRPTSVDRMLESVDRKQASHPSFKRK